MKPQILSGRAHVVVRNINMKLTEIQDEAVRQNKKNPALGNLRELQGRARVRLLIPNGVKLPRGFFDVDEKEAWRYQIYALVTEALNATAIEIENNRIGSIDELRENIIKRQA